MPTPSLLRPVVTRGDGLDVGQVALGVLDADEQERAEAAAEGMKSLREYAQDIPEPGIGELRFDDFPFQAAWYGRDVEDAEEVVLKKSAQIGASAFSWRFIVRRVDQFGDTGIYIFPTREHVTAFGDERIEPAIRESEYLLRRIPSGHIRSKSHKRIGRGFLHLRGSNSREGAQSVAAQVVVFDEYDLLDQVNLLQIERRTSGATQIGKKARKVRLGYPYTPGAGIDAQYKSSDQRQWLVTCSGCGEEQPIVWEENFRWTMPDDPNVYRPGFDVEELEDPTVLDEVWRCCRSCEQSFEDTSPWAKDGVLRRGRWVKRNPRSRRVGFEAWRGMVPVTNLRELVISSRATSEVAREAFYVLDLGRTYSSGSASLDLPTLARACAAGVERVEAYYGTYPRTMGVDVGDQKGIHVTIDEQLPPEAPGVPNRRRSLWIGTVSSFGDVAELMQRFGVSMCACDMQPERRLVRWLRALFPNQVVGVEFVQNVGAEPLRVKVDPNGIIDVAQVYRTDAIDAMMDAVRQVRWMPVQVPPPRWFEEMQALRRVTEVDRQLRPVRHYKASTPFDYAMSGVYALVATEMWRALIVAGQAIDAANGALVTDEMVGFRRQKLDVGGMVDQYHAGLGGV